MKFSNPIKNIKKYLAESEERELQRLITKRKVLQVKAKLAYVKKKEKDKIIEAKQQIKFCNKKPNSDNSTMTKKLLKTLG